MKKRLSRRIDERVFNLSSPTYTPGRALDRASRLLGCRCDADLARKIGVAAPQISRVRGKRNIMSTLILVAILDHTDLTIAQLRELAGLPVPTKLIE